ncbi:hypothetical protein OH773_06800 [Buttiauxella sp. WJP83]|uniref:hypothetical protein n=1 Tax=Buttiauxella sp. WJP83 TaxID=2986951 RepID=UPI0022DE11DD|nr:hypothetical protein [Buttiauxella sp. WJP83]WBM71944.1 hypothetical protein OH773_06800 [Buttiauxella sp. WJP83]
MGKFEFLFSCAERAVDEVKEVNKAIDVLTAEANIVALRFLIGAKETHKQFFNGMIDEMSELPDPLTDEQATQVADLIEQMEEL